MKSDSQTGVKCTFNGIKPTLQKCSSNITMNLLIVVVWLIKLSSLNAYYGVPRVGCRDESNNLIDWYYTYKLPN